MFGSGKRFREPGRTKWRAWIGTAGLIVTGGFLFAGGSAAIHATNSTEFCISCHEMRANNFAEYEQTIHARNRTGIKATCADCHVPHDLPGMMLRKVMAVSDIFHHLAGTVDTREKFERRRLQLATKVWQRMKDSDSRECRHCHDAVSMDTERQGRTAQKQHRKLESGERTCIDCHYGIAHREPEGIEPRDVVTPHG